MDTKLSLPCRFLSVILLVYIHRFMTVAIGGNGLIATLLLDQLRSKRPSTEKIQG